MPKLQCFVKPGLEKRWVQRMYQVGIDWKVKGCSLAHLPEPKLLVPDALDVAIEIIHGAG